MFDLFQTIEPNVIVCSAYETAWKTGKNLISRHKSIEKNRNKKMWMRRGIETTLIENI